MDKIVWTNDFSVGVEKIDRQHKKIIAMINGLIEQHNRGDSSEILTETLSQMTTYALEHLSDEEKFMEDINFPLTEEHEQLHEEFRFRIIDFSNSLSDGPDRVFPELLNYLMDWWSKHILHQDKKYSEYLRSDS